MGIEYERKFSATEAAQEALFGAMEGQWVTIAMHTTYYDTPDGALAARKWTLRHRLENQTHVCTIKTPAGNARGEWETECEDIEAAIPELCKLGGPAQLVQLTEKGVVAVCGAKFTRRALTVQWGEAVLELALDRGILFAGDRQEPLCEVEVELKQGSRREADRFSAVLAQKFALTSLEKSKFKRALSLREAL